MSKPRSDGDDAATAPSCRVGNRRLGTQVDADQVEFDGVAPVTRVALLNGRCDRVAASVERVSEWDQSP